MGRPLFLAALCVLALACCAATVTATPHRMFPPIFAPPASFRLWKEDRPYVARCYLDYTRGNEQLRYPAVLGVDARNERGFLYHNTTYHEWRHNRSAIALRLPSSHCGAMGGRHTDNFCWFTTEVLMSHMHDSYSADLRTDGIEQPVLVGRKVKNAVEYNGPVVDHHVAPYLIGQDRSVTPIRKAVSVQLRLLTDGNLKDAIQQWKWVMEMGGSTKPAQVFGIVCYDYDIRPSSRMFERPYVFTEFIPEVGGRAEAFPVEDEAAVFPTWNS